MAIAELSERRYCPLSFVLAELSLVIAECICLGYALMLDTVVHAALAVNCAGNHGDVLSSILGLLPSFTITPRKGQFVVFKPRTLVPSLTFIASCLPVRSIACDT